MNTDREKRKKIMIIASALFLCLVIGGIVYYTLRSISPTNNSAEIAQPASSNGDKLVKAKEARTAGEAALAGNDPETAVMKFTEAKQLYTEAGMTELVELINDQLVLAENEAAAMKNVQETEGPPRGTQDGKN